MGKKYFALLFFFAALLVPTHLGCGSDNYLIYEHEVEVPVEVPVYITEEVPGGDVWVDSFTQIDSVDGVDILWVVDQSGSMRDDNPRLLAGIEAMMLALPPTGWRLAMISADATAASSENQFPLVPGDDIQDATDMLNAMAVGQREAGFDAVYHYITSNPYSATWMRPDAALLVVFVSDEDDQSTALPSANEFVDWYQYQSSSPFVASIVNLPLSESACSTNASDTGDEYIAATNHFSGVVVDICSEDWSQGSVDAGRQLDPYEEWPLSHLPIPDTIRVFIDGALNPDWAYDPSENKVVFTTTPSGGSLVEIGYILEPVADTGYGDTG